MDLSEVVVVEAGNGIGAKAAERRKEVPLTAQRVGRGIPHGRNVLALADVGVGPFELETLVEGVTDDDMSRPGEIVVEIPC